MPKQLPIGPNGEIYNPTVKPKANFDAKSDAEKLRKAMKGIGTDEDTLVEVLGTITSEQRQEVKEAYKSLYGKDLVDDLKSETSGSFKTLLVQLMQKHYYGLAKNLRKAMKGAGTNEDCLIEIICTGTNEEIELIKDEYLSVLRDDGISDPSITLEKDICSECSGFLERIFVSLLQANRPEPSYEALKEALHKGISGLIDLSLVESDVERLYDAGEGKMGTDESVLIEVLANRSVFHIAMLARQYESKYNSSLLEAIESELSGDFKSAVKYMFLGCINRSLCFAKLLKKAMAGLGTNDNSLIRIIVSRSEIDLKDIMDEFQKLTGDSLENWVNSETSGEYNHMLLQLMGISWK